MNNSTIQQNQPKLIRFGNQCYTCLLSVKFYNDLISNTYGSLQNSANIFNLCRIIFPGSYLKPRSRRSPRRGSSPWSPSSGDSQEPITIDGRCSSHSYSMVTEMVTIWSDTRSAGHYMVEDQVSWSLVELLPARFRALLSPVLG